MKHLTSDDIKIAKPDYTNFQLSKGQVIVNWLIDWIKHALETGSADFGDFIPAKEELAKFLNVSASTIQNAVRQVKNLGYLCSKQSIGTYITDFYSKDLENSEILNTTVACCKIKKIILDEGFKLNSPILSVSELSKRTQISQNTIRLNLMELEQKGYLQRKKLKGNRYSWIYVKEMELTKEEIINGLEDENFTLTHQLLEKIQRYIRKTYKSGDKILPNSAFSRMFNVSVKTVNDAMKILNNKKIILSRRGKYGTIYLGENNSKNSFVTSERKQPSVAKYSYSWQKALKNLKKYIIENYKAGDKIAPIRVLASILNVSPNTIRRALKDLFENGYLISKRGKSGGIFIMELPEKEQTYKWLALNPDVVEFNN